MSTSTLHRDALDPASALITGEIKLYAGSSAPAGWLLCSGQAVSRTTYARLFAAIGTTYGGGDGSTTFNLPDLRGRVPVGRDDMGGTAAGRITTAGAGFDGAMLGANGGAQTHQLTEAQLPAHTHTYTQPTTAGQGFSSGNTIYASAVVGNTSSVGSSQAHNNTQPSLILNYIIRV